MTNFFERVSSGAGLGCTIGGALGVLFAGATLAIPGVNIVVAPLIAAATATTVTVSGSAAGTVIGAAYHKSKR